MVSTLVHAALLVAMCFVFDSATQVLKTYSIEGNFANDSESSELELVTSELDSSTDPMESKDVLSLASPSVATKWTDGSVNLDLDPLPVIAETHGILSDVQNTMDESSEEMPASAGRITDGRTGDKKRLLLQKYGGSPETEAAVARGLVWLAKQQQTDGSWSYAGPYSSPATFVENRYSATAMALLAFLGAGHTHLDGEYQTVVRRGLEWLCAQQANDGSCGQGTPRHHAYYTHAQFSLAICEAYGMTRDPWLQPYCDKATRFTIQSQGPQGGWQYEFKGRSDTSVTGWCLMALVSARSASIEIPATTFKRMSRWFDSVSQDNGTHYSYMASMPPTRTMTAEGLLCRMYLGWDKKTLALNSGTMRLLREHPMDVREQSYYYWYYATQVMHHFGGKEWETWNAAMKPQLVGTQVLEGPELGSWEPSTSSFDRMGGRLYSTCMVLYCLEVYYRHLPIYESPL